MKRLACFLAEFLFLFFWQQTHVCCFIVPGEPFKAYIYTSQNQICISLTVFLLRGDKEAVKSTETEAGIIKLGTAGRPAPFLVSERTGFSLSLTGGTGCLVRG